MNLSQTQNPLKMKNRTTFSFCTSRASGISIITPVFYLTILKSSASSDSLNLRQCSVSLVVVLVLCIYYESSINPEERCKKISGAESKKDTQIAIY